MLINATLTTFTGGTVRPTRRPDYVPRLREVRGTPHGSNADAAEHRRWPVRQHGGVPRRRAVDTAQQHSIQHM